jgi:hypothetical protein
MSLAFTLSIKMLADVIGRNDLDGVLIGRSEKPTWTAASLVTTVSSNRFRSRRDWFPGSFSVGHSFLKKKED